MGRLKSSPKVPNKAKSGVGANSNARRAVVKAGGEKSYIPVKAPSKKIANEIIL